MQRLIPVTVVRFHKDKQLNGCFLFTHRRIFLLLNSIMQCGIESDSWVPEKADRNYSLGKSDPEFAKISYVYERLQACPVFSCSLRFTIFTLYVFYNDWSVLKKLSLIYTECLKKQLTTFFLIQWAMILETIVIELKGC